jgi:hypothetical protein
MDRHLWIGNILQKENCKTFVPSFVFAVVNGGTVVDTRRIFTQFLIPISWAKTNILWIYNSIEFIVVFLMEVFLNLLCWGVS